MATPEELAEIRARLDLVEIVSRYVTVHSSGANYLARCPFHEDKRPSLTVSREKGLFHCFGCGAGGDIFQFIMQIERLSFPEAVRRLADQVGVALRSPGRADASGSGSERARLAGLNERVAQYYQRNLQRSGVGKRAWDYLTEQRGLTPETVKQFRLGYAGPGWDLLLRTFPAEQQVLQRLGLVSLARSGQRYDRLRDRVIFPLRSVGGELIAFAGRRLSAEETTPKYLNIANSPLFKKGRELYGLSQALPGLSREHEALLVEGYLDLITLHQAGFGQAVASMGTALTAGQAKLLRRYVERVYILYDRDSAGRAAAWRGLRQLIEAGLEARVALLPAGQDPDSLVRQQGADALREILAQAQPATQFYLDTLIEDHRGRGVRGQEEILAQVRGFIAGLDSLPWRYQLIRGLASRLDLPQQEIEREMQGARTHGIMAPTVQQGGDQRGPEHQGYEERLLYFILQGELPVSRLMELFTPAEFGSYREIVATLFALYQEEGGPERLSGPEGPALLQRWLARLTPQDGTRLRALSLSERLDDDPERAISQLLQAQRLRQTQRQLRELRRQIRQAQLAGDRQAVEQLQREQLQQSKEQAQLLREVGWQRTPSGHLS